MNYIVRSIVDVIINNLPENSEETMVRIDGFEDIEIYFGIAKKLSEEFENRGFSYEIRMAKSKKDYFEKKGGDTRYLEKMLQQHWVAETESVTHYRNLHESDILIFMGAEDEEDKGGLANCFKIDQAYLINNISGKYSEIFEENITFFSDEDKHKIDRMYSDLFKYVASDICLLSQINEEWRGQITTIDDFIEKFYEALPKWGLPFRKEEIISSGKITGRKNLLEKEYKFISGQMFKQLSVKKYESYENKIEIYDCDENKYNSAWSGWRMQGLKSYKELSDTLLEFIRGEEIEKNKSKLLTVDFSIIQAILDIKESTGTSKKTLPVYTGEPLVVFTKILLNTLICVKKEDIVISSIKLDIKKAEIKCAFSDVEEEEEKLILRREWEKICRHTNGVVEYINMRNFEYKDNEIEFLMEKTDIFNPSESAKHISDESDAFESDNLIVEAAAQSKKLSTIEIELKIFDEAGNEIPDRIIKKIPKVYKWKFAPSASWLNNFSDICDYLGENHISEGYLPLSSCKKIKKLFFAKSEEEFFDYYDESDINFSFNLLEDINERIGVFGSIDNNIKVILDKYNELGDYFSGFINGVYRNGLYKEIMCQEASSLVKLKDKYVELGNMLVSTELPENLKWLLDAFIFSFCIVEGVEIYTSDISADCCIVPSWHPAAIEKLADKNKFFLDGCEEWWEENRYSEKVSQSKCDEFIEKINELVMIQSALDIFPNKERQFIGNTNSFGLFSIFGRDDIKYQNRLKDLIKKDAVFDDDFDTREITHMSDDAKMLYDVLKDYQKAFPSAYRNLSLVFVDPTQLQPIIAALYRYTQDVRKKYPADVIDIVLKILVKPQNKGGKNYLAYWIDEFFAKDEKIKIRTYLNEWNKNEDLDKMLTANNDIIFLMELLRAENYNFVKENNDLKSDKSECKFPIVYKPSPVSSTSANTKRRIELSQPLFRAAYIHTQIVRKVKGIYTDTSDKYIAVREVSIDRAGRELVYKAHNKAYWVVCVDSGMDGALLRCDDDTNRRGAYSVIGFSTGKGSYGQYNLTVTARKSILDIIQRKLEKRLYKLFKWDNQKIKKAAQLCIKEAGSLDGISLLSAINMRDYNINEFMAYVLTSFIERRNIADKALKIIVHLDSYKHWFSGELEENKDGKKSRPDFLVLQAERNEAGKIVINATVVECKLSKVSESNIHKEKAVGQVLHGIDRLSYIFNQDSDSVMRRYWFAQLYRALAFAQITFCNNTCEFELISSGLRKILDGEYEINWSGKVLGFWIDMTEEERCANQQNKDVNAGSVTCVDVTQCDIQKLLLDDEEDIKYEKIDDIISLDEEELKEKSKEFDIKLTEELDSVYQGNNGNNSNKEDNSEFENNTFEQNKLREETEDDDKEVKKNIGLSNNFKEEKKDEEIKKEIAASDEKVEQISGSLVGNERVYIGRSKSGEKIYWEFGNKELGNRHLLITGTSGQGKTYCIQTMLYELSKNNISSVVFDYTEGFRPDQLEEEFKNKMDGKIEQHIVKIEKVPVNPFRRQEIEIAGQKITEPDVDVANRFANILSHVYGFGDQQTAAVFEAARLGLKNYGDGMNMNYFEKELRNIQSEFKSAQTVLSKMTPFLRSDLFDISSDFEWSDVLYPENAKMTIFQLTAIDMQMQIIITELMLWDAFYYSKKCGNKNKPFVVVLDEAQNLSHKENSPSKSILTEGRKFGWSAWYATQSLKVLDDNEVTRLMNAAYKINFKPTDDEVQKMSKQIDPSEPGKWLSVLKNLKKGQCIISGGRTNSTGVFGTAKPVVTDVAAFEERE